MNEERIGKFVADRTKPRPVRLVFSSLIYKHSFLEFSKDFRQAGFRLDDDLTKSQQAERKSLSLDFQSLKTKGYQPYFRGPAGLASAVLQRQRKPHMCEGKSRQNPSSHTMIWNMHVAISMHCRPPARFHLSQTSCLYISLGMMTSMSTC